MFSLYGTAISSSDARYLVRELERLGWPEATDAIRLIERGAAGRRTAVPLTPGMQDAVCAALCGAPPSNLVELRRKAERKTLLVREW